jgi:hypothetical protein
VAFDARPDGTRIYLCSHHLPNEDVDPLTGRVGRKGINRMAIVFQS